MTLSRRWWGGPGRIRNGKTPGSLPTAAALSRSLRRHTVTWCEGIPGTSIPTPSKFRSALRRDGVDFDLRVVGDRRVLDSVKRAVRRERRDDYLTFTAHVAAAQGPCRRDTKTGD